jgi:hypothetical protein
MAMLPSMIAPGKDVDDPGVGQQPVGGGVTPGGGDDRG